MVFDPEGSYIENKGTGNDKDRAGTRRIHGINLGTKAGFSPAGRGIEPESVRPEKRTRIMGAVDENHQERWESEAEEEAEQRTLDIPDPPTKEEYERHQATHIPFRCWCEYCVRGKAKSGKRWEKKEEQRGTGCSG